MKFSENNMQDILHKLITYEMLSYDLIFKVYVLFLKNYGVVIVFHYAVYHIRCKK